ncbi:ATP-binding cassette domain-containing protein [Prolixibacteraceae bacterium JC049]|nr:ATP-binding cassette domain-containing protein [Prolixibacteraceae bacterium JC049]
MIAINNIGKSFGGKQIISGISSTFENGKTHLIIGQSGSGKTVLLKTISGLYQADSGAIDFDGRSLMDMNQKEQKLLRQEIGMVFQGGALFDSLSVADNVRFPLDMFWDVSEAEKRDRVDFCLERVKIVDAHNKFPAELSGGMQKRVAIARAIALNPKYLFCDEPNSGLDPVTAIVIDNLIAEITAEFGITTIINTHDMNSVMEIGEKILFIHKGHKEWEGSSKEVLNTENEALNSFIFSSKLTAQLKK